MKLPEFIQARQPTWDELSGLLDRSRDRPHRLEPDEIRRLGALYRAASADLAAARRRFGRGPMVEDLEKLVVRAQAAVYGEGALRRSLRSFFGRSYWNLIAERGRPLALATVLLLVPASLGFSWALYDADSLVGVLPPDFLWVTEAGSTDQSYGTAGLVGFSTFVLTNNIRVTLTAFVLGITWGIGTGWIIAQNGLIFGAVVGLAIEAGNWRTLLAAIVAHGILEFSCILIGGAAGLSLGRAILRPGRDTRREALAKEARVAVQLALGTAVWLVLAGFVEGFASRTGLGWIPTTIIGITIGAVFWGLVWWRGRTGEVMTVQPV